MIVKSQQILLTDPPFFFFMYIIQIQKNFYRFYCICKTSAKQIVYCCLLIIGKSVSEFVFFLEKNDCWTFHYLMGGGIHTNCNSYYRYDVCFANSDNCQQRVYRQMFSRFLSEVITNPIVELFCKLYLISAIKRITCLVFTVGLYLIITTFSFSFKKGRKWLFYPFFLLYFYKLLFFILN